MIKIKRETTALLLIFSCFIASAATFDVAISNFKYTPNDLTISVGDTVRWTNTAGFHDVREDGNSFSSGDPSSDAFVFEHTFQSVEEVLYYCSVHSSPGADINASMNGRINVVAGEESFKINQGMSGAWFFPDTAGSGLLLDVRPSDQFLFAAWFTYDVSETRNNIGSSDNRWFTAQGNYTDGTAADLALKHTSGGIFDNSQDVSTVTIGSMTFEFTSCTQGTVSYAITEDDLSGSFPIQRVIPGTESLCEDLDAISDGE